MGAGVLVLSFAGCAAPLTPSEAYARQLPLRTLTDVETRTLSMLGETLLPGSVAAGFVHYIDHQLAVPASQCMFMAKYVGVSPPFLDFYRPGLAAVESLAQRRFGKSASALEAKAAHMLVSALSSGAAPGWEGPPAPLLYFVLRSDAVDVSYGSRAGFERLGVPYMPHIEPPARWGA